MDLRCRFYRIECHLTNAYDQKDDLKFVLIHEKQSNFVARLKYFLKVTSARHWRGLNERLGRVLVMVRNVFNNWKIHHQILQWTLIRINLPRMLF